MKSNSCKLILLSSDSTDDSVLNAEDIKNVFDTFKELNFNNLLKVKLEGGIPNAGVLEIGESLFTFLSERLKAEKGSIVFYSRILHIENTNSVVLSLSHAMFIKGVEAYRRQLESFCTSLTQDLNDTVEELDSIRGLIKSIVNPLRNLI